MFRSRRILFAFVLVALTLALAMPAQARPGGVSRFAILPPGPGHPEGIAADAAGNVYVATFEFPPAPNRIYVFGSGGRLEATKNLSHSPLGMLVVGGALWVADFGAGDAVKYALPLSATSSEAARIDVCGGAGGRPCIERVRRRSVGQPLRVGFVRRPDPQDHFRRRGQHVVLR